MDTKKVMSSALAGFVAIGLTAAANSAIAADTKSDMEKCYGIVKSGMNDCASAGHSCAAHGSKDGDPSDWLYVPKGTCAKIVGGSPSAPTEKKGDETKGT